MCDGWMNRLLAVISDARLLRLFDRDHHRRHDRHAREKVGAQFLVDLLRNPLAPRLELEAPDAKGIGAQDELRAHLLQALDAKCGSRWPASAGAGPLASVG